VGDRQLLPKHKFTIVGHCVHIQQIERNFGDEPDRDFGEANFEGGIWGCLHRKHLVAGWGEGQNDWGHALDLYGADPAIYAALFLPDRWRFLLLLTSAIAASGGRG